MTKHPQGVVYTVDTATKNSCSKNGYTADTSVSAKSKKGDPALIFRVIVCYVFADVAASTPKRKRMCEINAI